MIKVVIADDEDNVCQLIRGLIDWKSLDMEIVGIAHNGVEALDLIKMHSPDLMITDIRMPGYDGLEMIEHAKIINDSLDFIIISGYRHFEYAQNAIKYGVGDYLLKPIKKEELLTALNKMRERYIQRTEQMSNEERLKMRLKSDVIKLRSNLFTERLLKKGMTTNDLTMETINENYHFLFEPGLFQVCAVKIDCGFEDQYDNTIRILEDKVTQILNSLLKLEDVKLLKDSFRSARYAVGQRLLLGTGKFIENVTMEAQSQRVGGMLAEMNRTMGTALEVLDKNAMLNCIAALKQQIVAENILSGREIFSLAQHVCEMYLTHLRNNQIQVQNSDEFYEKFCIHENRCNSIDQLFKYLSITIGGSLDVIIADKKQADTKPIRLAKQYIQQNFMKPISLEEVSGYVGFNPTYFSTLFKKESGSNFVDYLAEIRMNRAKELLRESNLSIAAICEQVGYNDLKNFTKIFKKNVKLKPNEYRKLYS